MSEQPIDLEKYGTAGSARRNQHVAFLRTLVEGGNTKAQALLDLLLSDATAGSASGTGSEAQPSEQPFSQTDLDRLQTKKGIAPSGTY